MVVLLAWGCETRWANAQPTGTPIVQAFPRQAYGGSIGQVFDGVQDARGILYFSTTDSGLLEFDGERWRERPVASSRHALAIDRRGRLWLGGAGSLGYYETADDGTARWRELTDLLPESQRVFSNTWPILVTDGGLYFASREFLFRYRDTPEPHFDAWPSETDEIFYRLYEVDGRLLVAQLGVGLVELTAEQRLVPIGDGELAGSTEINALFGLGDGTLLAFTRLRGIFRIDGRRVEPVAGSSDDWLRSSQVQHGCELPDGRFAIATRRGGLGVVDRDLDLDLALDTRGGLTDNGLNTVFLDRRQQLWATSENGVNHVILDPAAIGFGAAAGLPEAGVSKVAALEDEIYVATVAGLYRGDRASSAASAGDVRFEASAVLETQTWDLLPIGDGLLAATTDGIFDLRSRRRTEISIAARAPLSRYAAFAFLPLPPEAGDGEPTRVLVGMARGLGLLERDGELWRFVGRLPGLQLDVWDLARGEDGEILAYMPSPSRLGVVHFADGVDQPPEVLVSEAAGGGFVELDGAIYRPTAAGYARYRGLAAARRGEAFTPASELDALEHLGVEAILLEDSRDRLWVSTERGLRLAVRDAVGGDAVGGEYRLDSISQRLVEMPFTVTEDPRLDETFWVGTIDGLLRITPQKASLRRPAPPTLVRRVTTLGTQRVLDGGGLAGAGGRLEPPVLEFEDNGLRFEFAAPIYGESVPTLYRVRLDGFEDKWTEWSEQSLKEYTSLFEGSYTFRAQAQDARGAIGPTASWSFRILPPWYRTPWAFASYFFTAVGVVLLLVWARTARLDRRREALEGQIAVRTRELASEKDQVERQAADLERVNRLLAEENEHRRQLEKERAKLQLRAEQSQKLESLGMMAGGIAHDFNNILMAILGNADLCLEEDGLRDSLERRLRAISDSGRRAAELCQQMLAYAGKGRFEEREIDLSKLTAETIEILRVSIDDAIRLDIRLDDRLPGLLGDPSKVSQLLLNLLLNAAEAIGAGPGRLTITTGTRHIDAEMQQRLVLADPIPEGPYVFIEVEDDGEGMDEDTRRRLFDPFFTTKFAGRGLGMAATLGILRSHGGAISVDSELGHGTTIAAFFPALDHRANEAESRTTASVRLWRPRGTVLVVDDEAVVRDVVELMLRNTGFDVLTASSGQEALEIYGEHLKTISVVILDLTMPGLDGLATFERLRLLDPEVKVLLSSGYSGDTLVERYLEQGFAGFIAKPYRPSALRSELRRILG